MAAALTGGIIFMYDVENKDTIKQRRYSKEGSSSPVVCVLRAKFKNGTSGPWKAAGHASRNVAHYYPLTLRPKQDYPALDHNDCCSHDALTKSFDVGEVPDDGDCLFTCIRRLFVSPETQAAPLPTAADVRERIANAVTTQRAEPEDDDDIFSPSWLAAVSVAAVEYYVEKQLSPPSTRSSKQKSLVDAVRGPDYKKKYGHKEAHLPIPPYGSAVIDKGSESKNDGGSEGSEPLQYSVSLDPSSQAFSDLQGFALECVDRMEEHNKKDGEERKSLLRKAR